MVHFILYSRSYCHLCDDMLQALQTWRGRYPFTVEVVDVDADQQLVALYDELVPLLVGVRQGEPPAQICHYFLDNDKLQAFFSK